MVPITVSPFAASIPLLSEALALGFASGSACLASCGVLLLPWLTGMRRGWRGTCGLLGIFLGGAAGRLSGLRPGSGPGWTGSEPEGSCGAVGGRGVQLGGSGNAWVPTLARPEEPGCWLSSRPRRRPGVALWAGGAGDAWAADRTQPVWAVRGRSPARGVGRGAGPGHGLLRRVFSWHLHLDAAPGPDGARCRWAEC